MNTSQGRIDRGHLAKAFQGGSGKDMAFAFDEIDVHTVVLKLRMIVMFFVVIMVICCYCYF